MLEDQYLKNKYIAMQGQYLPFSAIFGHFLPEDLADDNPNGRLTDGRPIFKKINK